ncbi:hypothetical protein K1T71_007002 [Dendrolimus kikuchii]|uniref:Uncharacterized protein n=1 Tax=Dendrolimus kikuchii TaxID=765133 RepID=A0ACC1CZ98_9NEOP|nr:hypothetical protein K1T71_007002 [Dendrolimus kikuchii]
MPSESKPLLTAQTEKPNHYKYLKEFRVEQCPSFLQHKCTQHRPFTCFHWHFNNQRRRRPVRKRDGTFNYSADNYCTKYNETSGICEDGDECPYLHRTAGDTERRYHLRYYKTCMCVHDTDARGLCTKNGAHCAFAHGAPDLRPPVLDVRELQALDHPDAHDADAQAPNALDRERNLMNEDPKWQDTNYVLSSYKTEPCKRPPRLCRQGYACPQYHNSKDKRRSPRKYKYRSTPCPNVKHGEEWGEPSNCEAGDACGYCHTRTEQQFHPEIYKSTKCNDVQQAGYCPRGLFCAFAHVEPEEPATRDHPLDCTTSLAELLSSALPPDKKADSPPAQQPPSHVHTNAHVHANGADGSECASTSSGGSGGRRPFAAEVDIASKVQPPPHPQTHHSTWAQRAPPFDATVLQEVVGNALDELHLEDPLNLVAALDRDIEAEVGSHCASAPVNIPGPGGRGLRGFSPPPAAGGSPLPPFLRYAPPEPERAFNSHAMKAGSFGGGGGPFEYGASPSAPAELSRLREECMVCEEQPRSVTLAPCNHYVLCDKCAATADECPYCQTPVQHHQ